MGFWVDIQISSGDAGNVAIVRCEGELDMATAAKLIDAFDRVGFLRPDEVQVDLRGVEFMDSTGLGCLTHGALAFQREGAGFDVLPSEPVKELLKKAGLEDFLAYQPNSRDSVMSRRAARLGDDGDPSG
jgi:anti-sigma B factor antagonist